MEITDSVLFYTLIVEPYQARNARLMVESLRAFGGPLAGSPVWVFYVDPASVDPDGWQDLHNVRVLPLGDVHAPSYWFSRKVHVCARAEALAGPEIRSPSLPVILATDPSVARLPYKILRCPVFLIGFESGKTTFCPSLRSGMASRFSARLLPVTVRQSP